MPTDADSKILAKLFADEPAPFRHRLSLFRIDAGAFYAATAEAGSIRAQKQAILTSAAADLHVLETDEGSSAFTEFVRIVGGNDGQPVAARDLKSRNRAATLALEPDWMILAPPDARLVWASVCFPTRWSLAGKGLHPLADVHAVVPGLNAELGRKIDVFFGRLVAGEGWGRANWGLSSNGERNQHPRLPYEPLSDRTPLETVFLRIESQHLLKMPVTGAIAFGIRILSVPLAEVREHPGTLAGLKEQLRTMPGDVSVYKGIPADFWRRL